MSTKKFKVFIVQKYIAGNAEYAQWICSDPFMERTKTPEEADILVFTGGADICPARYGQPKHPRTYTGMLDQEDFEVAMFHLGVDKLKVGICRGAQLLNVLSGGSMFQHVPNHTSRHAIKLVKEDVIMQSVLSTHHQMMIPSPKVDTRTILGVAYNGLGGHSLCSIDQKETPPQMTKQRENFLDTYTSSDFNPRKEDLEIVHYHSTNSLCIQSHPERLNSSPKTFTAYCNHLITELAARNTARLNLRSKLCVDT